MDFKNIPFAEFLEQAIPCLVSMKATKIALVAINANDEVGSTYYNTTPTDKAVMADTIQFDAWLEKLEANREHIKELLEDEPDD